MILPRHLFFMLCALAAGSAQQAGAVVRTETVECELPDGGQFVLRATHQWTPAAVFARHASSRSNQTGFEVLYRARGSRDLLGTGGTFDYRALQTEAVLDQLCGQLAVIDGQPGTGFSLRMPGDTQFWVPASTGRIDAGAIAAGLRQRGLNERDERSVMAVRGGVLVREVPLVAGRSPACADAADPDSCVVEAVARIVSDDRGVSWRDPHVEQAPWFFRIGAPLSQQTGFARPSRRSVKNHVNSDDGAGAGSQPCPNRCSP